jgi:hypothetical protein
VVTLLAPLLPLEPEPEDDDVDPLLCELDVLPDELVVGLDATVVADDDVLADVFFASAGSWPETSTSVIISQAATNSATDPAMIRRRMVRARATRAVLSACPRARASARLLSVMAFPRGRVKRSVRSASARPVASA